MIKLFIGFLVFVLVSAAQAADITFVLMGGLRSNSGSTDLADASVSSTTAFHFGSLGVIPIQGNIAVRGGFVFSQRNVVIGPTNSGDVDVNLTYVDVPLTPMWLFTEYAGAFAGPVIAMNFSKECERENGATCEILDAKSAVFPLTAGVHFRFAPQMGGELSYEFVPGEVVDGLSDVSSVVASFLVYFE